MRAKVNDVVCTIFLLKIRHEQVRIHALPKSLEAVIAEHNAVPSAESFSDSCSLEEMAKY